MYNRNFITLSDENNYEYNGCDFLPVVSGFQNGFKESFKSPHADNFTIDIFVKKKKNNILKSIEDVNIDSIVLSMPTINRKETLLYWHQSYLSYISSDSLLKKISFKGKKI